MDASFIEREMEIKELDEIVAYLQTNKTLLRDQFGVSRLGLFGSFVSQTQHKASDIDMVVDFEKDKKNIHSFLQLKRFLEKEFSRKVDLGLENSLKPAVRKKIEDQILYV